MNNQDKESEFKDAEIKSSGGFKRRIVELFKAFPLESECDTFDILARLQFILDEFEEYVLTSAREEIERQNRIIGRLITQNEYLKDSENKRREWLSKAKNQVGVDDNVSFDDVWNKLREQNERLKKERDEFAAAMQWFVDRVDKGEVRSRKTYDRFKELLSEYKKSLPE